MSIRIALLVLTVLTLPSAARACSCIAVDGPIEAARSSDLVFSGRVERIEPTTSTAFLSDLAVTFAVERVWKGTAMKSEVVGTSRQAASCGYHFEIGSTYLVFARFHNGRPTTGSCSYTRLLSDGIRDAAALGIGRAIERGVMSHDPGVKSR